MKTASPRTFTPNKIAICWSSSPSQTGGRYWEPSDLKNLPRDISYSEAGISVRDDKGVVGYADRLYVAARPAYRRVAASPQVGCGMKRAHSRRSLLFAALRLTLHARAAAYFVIVAGLGGEPDYEQRFTAAANDLDKIFKAAAAVQRMSTRSPERRPRAPS